MSSYLSFNKQEEEHLFVLPKYNEELQGNFSTDIYNVLPDQLRSLLELADDHHEKDILLLGILTVMSGCMPNVKVMYDRKWVSPNLYTFIEAPAGAGKGVLSWARLIGAPVHQLLREESRFAWEQYDQLKKDKAKQKDAEYINLTEPPNKMLFIPTNNSASSMVQTLAENNGAGILFSTEADSLANSLAQDWGNFSDVLRCAFHHEPIDLQRRLNREYLSVEEPCLSVLLTGTKGQLLRLIPNTENGLFSRFMYYSFPAVPNFRNVFQQNGNDPGRKFKEMGQVVLEMYQFLKGLDEPMIFYLEESLAEEFVKDFKYITKITYNESGNQILGTVHRLGLIAIRISMVLAMFRYFTYPNRPLKNKIKITERDFSIGLDLVRHLLYHATVLVADMKEGSKQVLQHSKNLNLYNRLPETFTRSEAINLAQTMGISNSTLGRYLLNGHFDRVGKGSYKKILINQQ